MTGKTERLEAFNWTDFDDVENYPRWRDQKLHQAEKSLNADPVAIKSLAAPSESERAEILLRCRNTNFAHYASPDHSADSENMRASLRTFASSFGLNIAEAHRSAHDGGIVALKVSAASSQRGYIPYTNRSMNWHTDGYYNAPRDRVLAFVLHCVQQAERGGTNDLLDPEIVYIRLREANPAHLHALMQPDAMSIPANTEPDGSIRPVSIGPVFFPDPATGRLQMRYTARTRSIGWKDDAPTIAAEAALREILQAPDPLTHHVALVPGAGVLNNNVLHNRSGFEDGDEPGGARLIYRVRFHNRVGGGN